MGVPEPETRWLKQGVEIKQSQEYQIEEMEDGTSILIISEVYEDDAGEIVFEAHNALGAATTVAALSVDGQCFTCQAGLGLLHSISVQTLPSYFLILVNTIIV